MVLLGVVVKLQKHFPVKQYLKIFNDSNNYPKISDLQPQSCNHEDHEEARRNTKSDHEAATTWGTRNLHISDCGLRNADLGLNLMEFLIRAGERYKILDLHILDFGPGEIEIKIISRGKIADCGESKE